MLTVQGNVQNSTHLLIKACCNQDFDGDAEKEMNESVNCTHKYF